MWLLIVYTFSNASEIQIQQDGAIDIAAPKKVADLPWGIFQHPEAGTGGDVTLNNQTAKKLVSASTPSAFIVEYTINSPFVRWRFTSTGGLIGDTVQVFLIKRGL